MDKILLLLLLLGFTPAKALDRVDVALILSVDVSASVTSERYEVQKTGIEDALVDPEIINAIMYGDYNRIALMYIEWSGFAEQKVVVPWTIIASKIDAENFVKRMEQTPRAFANSTGIGAAIQFSIAQFDTLPYVAIRKIIDVSGDGSNNAGPEPVPSEVPEDIIINGLPILELEPQLEEYYEKYVQAGIGSFVEPVNSYADVKFGFKRKLTREVAFNARRD